MKVLLNCNERVQLQSTHSEPGALVQLSRAQRFMRARQGDQAPTAGSKSATAACLLARAALYVHKP